MTGFLVKKFFYDLWDNLFFIFFFNFGFLVATFPAIGAAAFFFPFSPLIGIIATLFFLYPIFVYLCAAAGFLKKISDYGRPNLADFIVHLKNALLPAIILYFALLITVFILFFTIPVYFNMGGMAGMTMAFLSFWTCLFLIASLQFYPAIYLRLGKRPFICLKKCFLFFIDNAGFCICSLIINVFFILMVFTTPCFSLLFLDEAFRLRFFKYDWLEKKFSEQGGKSGGIPSKMRKKIPWNDILAEEMEKTGAKSIRSFFFPWKD